MEASMAKKANMEEQVGQFKAAGSIEDKLADYVSAMPLRDGKSDAAERAAQTSDGYPEFVDAPGASPPLHDLALPKADESASAEAKTTAKKSKTTAPLRIPPKICLGNPPTAPSSCIPPQPATPTPQVIPPPTSPPPFPAGSPKLTLRAMDLN